MDLIAEINREEGTTFLISRPRRKIAALCRRKIVVDVDWSRGKRSPASDRTIRGRLPAAAQTPRLQALDTSCATPEPRSASGQTGPAGLRRHSQRCGKLIIKVRKGPRTAASRIDDAALMIPRHWAPVNAAAKIPPALT
jgi:hypothetical protein